MYLNSFWVKLVQKFFHFPPPLLYNKERRPVMKAILFGIITVLGSCTEIREEVNPEGPWYSEQFLEENSQYVPDIYLCGNYYKHQYVTKHKEEPQALFGSHDFFLKGHTVPIICGPKDGECGIVNCDCVCHKE